MPSFLNIDMKDLAMQLARSPRRLRVEQVLGVEMLLGLIKPDQAYPFEFVCYHITGYRKRGDAVTTGSIPGDALIKDLVTLAETITRSSQVPISELAEPFCSQQDVAAQLGVSTKTVRRWRNKGLMGIRVVYEDGINRLAFLKKTVDRFTAQHQALVRKGAAFTQLTDVERNAIVDRARELVSGRPMKMHAVAQRIAAETDRAVETIRYTLRRYDATHKEQAVFAGAATAYSRIHEAMWNCRQAGDSFQSIAAAFNCTADDAVQAVRFVQIHQWKQQRWDGIHDELFDAPDADRLILEMPEPPASGEKTTRVPQGLPSYLQALYRTPLLTPDLERDLFRRYNYVKFKVARLLENATDATDYETIEPLVQAAETLKQRIVQANLRLVVSIAKKHVGWSPRFFEVISDGNVSLMRAVEGFDYTRGVKFSTYATWAIVKNYARAIPEQRVQSSRYVTGQDELLEAAPDHRDTETVHASDRASMKERITAALSALTPREREIVVGHFGLTDGGTAQTLEQLGQKFGVTKERVRQIERKALGQLKDLLDPSLAELVSA